MKITKENLRDLFYKIWTFAKKHSWDLFFTALLGWSIYSNFSNIKFIYKANALTLHLIIPLIIIFIWLGIHSKPNKDHLLATASTIIAVFVYLLSFAYSDDSKIKLLSDMDGYNCFVSQGILNELPKGDLSQNLSLFYFISQPYFDNASFIAQRLGTSTGTELLRSALAAQSANSLIDQVQHLNVQVSEPSLYPLLSASFRKYNARLIEIASSTNKIFCQDPW
jgi:predicted neutral ceramidase superfamily lipid hydrolase